jgi:hypothetical protein
MNKIFKTTLLTILVLILLTSIVMVAVVVDEQPFTIVMSILGFSILTVSIWNIIYINLKD